MNFHMFKMVLEKAKEPQIKLPTSAGSWKKQESSRKTSISAYDYAKAFDCVDQEATVRTGHGTDWFQIGKGVRKGCILSP